MNHSRLGSLSSLIVLSLACGLAACSGDDGEGAEAAGASGASGAGAAGAAGAAGGGAGKAGAGGGASGKGGAGGVSGGSGQSGAGQGGAAGSAGGGAGGGAGASGAGSGQGGAGQGGAGAGGEAGAGAGAGGGAGECEAFGVFGVPAATFTLPVQGKDSVYYPDVQKSFPDVDWAKLDRLYIPAGKYKTFSLGNLPARDEQHRLVITNLGGQVQVGPNLGGNFIWSMGGGSGWVLTGRYDPVSKTGDEAFAGHRCGQYAGTRGKYGFLSDDALDKSGPYLHMGISVGDATSFEIEFVEVTRSGFAGIRLLNKRESGQPERPMANVRVHDTYVHDVAAEGFYFGWTGAPPSNPMPGLQVYNNRLLRTGNEALQIQQVGEGSHIHHNTMAFADLHWLDNDLGAYQDNNSQMALNPGATRVEDNIFLGGAANMLNMFSAVDGGAGPKLTFARNYVGESSNLLAYFGGAAGAESSFTFSQNTFGAFVFAYDTLDPSAKPPGALIGINGTVKSPFVFDGNRWDFDYPLTYAVKGPNGASGQVTATNNTRGAVEPVTFVASGYPAGAPVRGLTIWAPLATRTPGSPPIVYPKGALAMDGGELYECTADSSQEPPHATPGKWKKLPFPADDVRTTPGSPYAGMGVR